MEWPLPAEFGDTRYLAAIRVLLLNAAAAAGAWAAAPARRGRGFHGYETAHCIIAVIGVNLYDRSEQIIEYKIYLAASRRAMETDNNRHVYEPSREF
ncbi:hypothetical protein EVAR_44546_1 [Eumeta japonica]|uniref:Uncharacterized protein n=1 Tax=Eumeta variegata TaxID=151549 RepID=A0A4C1X9Z6_EUMVA|nr:hypothetical protein EVAR_44546_1 [Eumeta japonica]